MVVQWLSLQLRRFWWWARGVDAETYRALCVRCHHTGQAHLLACGCRRFVKPDLRPCCDSEGDHD